ncbi:MAG: dephospho-CoA kinase [Gammaproteobacteria bacterium]|nr:MAG: dephospho-CoA kinase [Gammaproteobacteria bacterium]
MLSIGLTGGIASGKTLVSGRLAERGAFVIDADVIAREVVEPGSAGLNALVNAFSPVILTADKALDRQALRRIIFSDDTARERVNDILHPLIRQRGDELRQAAAASGEFPYSVHAIPLLLETGQADRFDRILVVDVPRDIQLDRLMDRDGADRSQAEAILDAQASREDRLAIADDIIDNSGSPENTLAATDALHRHYLELAGAGR